MKQNITILLTILSVLIILDSLNAGYALTMLLLAGVVPGTNIVLSAATMLEFFALVFGFTIARVSVALVQAYVSYQSSKRTAVQNTTA